MHIAIRLIGLYKTLVESLLCMMGIQ